MKQMSSEFAQEYLQICKEKSIEPHNSVLKCLHRPCACPGSHGRAVLNLTATSLDEQTCAVLGKLLSIDRHFEEIRLADCALTDSAVMNIICGLNTNTACTHLDLKGNSIRGKSVECLGRLLRQNTKLERLDLEWNNVGMLDDAFMVFCDGLGSNSSLKCLDLRNNCISHYGAQELAEALKRNTTLQSLDLSWNGVGLVGGRALLDAFKFNKTLTQIKLAGNDIPAEIVRAIENAARSNAHIHGLASDYCSRTKLLTTELKKCHRENASQHDELMRLLEEKDDKLQRTNRMAAQKVAGILEVMEENKTSLNTLSCKLARCESELMLAEQRVKDLEIILEKERQNKEDISASYRSELRNAKVDHTQLESRLAAELTAVTEKCNETMSELIELRKRSAEQKAEIHALNEKIATLEANAKLATTNFQDKMKKEQLKHTQTLEEALQLKDREIAQLHADRNIMEKSLREHISKVERQRMDCEEEVAKIKVTMIAERSRFEEDLCETRQKLKSDQEFHIRHVEDKLKLVNSAKNDIQQMNSQQLTTIADLQSKNGSLTLEADNLRRRIEALQQNVAAQPSEIAKAIHLVEQQVAEKTAELVKEQQKHKNTKEKLAKLEQQLEEQSAKQTRELDGKATEVKNLKEALAKKEACIAQLRGEMQQRAYALQTAVRSYAEPLPNCTA